MAVVGAGIFRFLKRDCVIQFSLFPSFLALYGFKDPALVLPVPNPLPLMAPPKSSAVPICCLLLVLLRDQGHPLPAHCPLLVTAPSTSLTWMLLAGLGRDSIHPGADVLGYVGHPLRLGALLPGDIVEFGV